MLCELVRQLSEKYDMRVGLIGASSELFDEISEKFLDVPVEVFSFPCPVPFSLSCIRKISKFIDKNGIELVHCHGYKSDVYGYLASFPRRRTALVATNHNWLFNTINERIYKQIDLRVLRRFDCVVSVSKVLFDEMISGGVPRRKLRIIDNGIDVAALAGISRESARARLKLDDSIVVAVCVASLTPEKAHRTLLRVLFRHDEALASLKLFIVGDGPLRMELESIAESLGVRRQIEFLGHRNDVRELYAAFDMFVLASEKEGLPMALLEAMAVGLPVVVTGVGAIPKVITGGKEGYLVRPGDIDGIAEALKELIQIPEKRATMGRESLATVSSRYSSWGMAEDYESLYRELLK